MERKWKKVLMIAGVVAVLIVIALILGVFAFDINMFKPRIETAVSGATGLDVRINGEMRLSFFPFGVSADDIHVAGKEGEILSLQKLTLGSEFIPLLKKQLNVTGCELVKPVVNIVRNTDGIYNFETTGKTSRKRRLEAAFSLKELRLTQGTLAYLDRKTGEKTEFKEINLAIGDLSTAGTAENIIKNASFTGTMGCKEVLQRDFKIENLKVSVKAAKGIYDFEPLAVERLIYFDRKTGKKTEFKEINLAIRDLSTADTSENIINNVSCTGTMGCKEVRQKALKIENVRSPVKVEKGVIVLIPLTMEIFGGKGEGDASADKSEVDAVYKINLKVLKLDFEKLQESLGTKKVIGGKGDLYASLTMKENGSRSLMSSMDGTLSLQGDNLLIYTMNLDKALSSFEKSQQFNLVDLGAFFITGPLSTVALKGYDYGNVYAQTRGGQDVIKKFMSRWKIKNSVADAMDCALATRHNRIALKGKLNLVGKRYENVTVALLDDRGCAKFKQSVSGSFDSPQVGRVSAFESLGGPIFNLYRKTKRLVQGDRCEVFYNGSVQQP